MSTDNAARVYVAVDSPTVSSRELTAILRLTPDESWDVGSTYRIAGKDHPERFNRWSIMESASDVADICEAVERLKIRITTVIPALPGLPADATIRLLAFITTPDMILGLGMSNEALRFWSGLGAHLDVSLVIDVPEPGTAAPPASAGG